MRQEAAKRPRRLTDEEVEYVRSQVENELIGRLRNFRLQRRSHGLVLCGHTDTYYARQLAEQAVMQATDLPILDNQIEVLPTWT